jgi:hypothetical protein
LPWGGDIAIFFPEMANSRGGGWAPLELTDTLLGKTKDKHFIIHQYKY